MTAAQILIVFSLISFLIVGFFVKKSDASTFSGFTMSRGKLNWFVIAAGISMTFAGGAAILNTASLGFTFKWYTLVDPIALLIGIIISIILYKKYLSDNGTTISDLLSSNSRNLSVLIGIITSFVFVLIVAAQFVALSKLISPFFPNANPLLITFIFSTSVFAYVFWGGFNSVTKTDILQLILIVAFLIVPLLLYLIFIQNDYETSYEHTFIQMPIDYIILFSIPIVFTPLSQDINIRIKSAKNSVNGKIGLLFGAIFYFSIVLCSALIGIYLGKNNIQVTDPEQALSIFFRDYFPSFGFIGVIAALSAIVSSLDSYTLNSIISISNDLVSPTLGRKFSNTKSIIRFSAIITYVFAMSIALFFNQILGLILTSLLIYISILLPIAIANFLKIKSNIVFSISLINISVILLVEFFKINVSPKAILYPLFGICLFLIAFLIRSLRNGNK